MTVPSKEPKTSSGAASAALFVVILATMVLLATLTDLHAAARWGISIVAGIAAAAVTHALVSRKRSNS